MHSVCARVVGVIVSCVLCVHPIEIPFSRFSAEAWANWWGTQQDLTDLHITENTTWNSETDLSGYENIYIENDAQLTIEAGSHISLRHLVVVWGNIVAQGTMDHMITITREKPHKNIYDPDRDRYLDEYCAAGEYIKPALQFDAYADLEEDRESIFTFVTFEGMGIDHTFDDDNCPAMTLRDRVQDLIAPSAYASDVVITSPAILYRSGRLRMENCIFEHNYTKDIQIEAAYSDILNTLGYVHIENSNFHFNSQNFATEASFKYVQQTDESDACVHECTAQYNGDPWYGTRYAQCAISCMGEKEGVHDKNRVTLKNNWYGHANGPSGIYQDDPQLGEKVYGDLILDGWRPTADMASNVLFLPGIKASRLYVENDEGDYPKIWEPGDDHAIDKLTLKENGESVRDDIFTEDVVDEVFVPVIGGNIYKSFMHDLVDMKTTNMITDYSLYAYDWRKGINDILFNGTKYPGGEIKKPIDEVERLAQSSVSGKVTIVAHSNGGLLAKAMVQELEKQGKSDLVDNVILVSSPQMGTPKSLLSFLYGHDEGLAISWLMDNARARKLMENMPGAYGLLPSEEYFDRTQSPIIHFTSSRDPYKKYRDAYGDEIDDYDEFRKFLLAEDDERKKPAWDAIGQENVVNEDLLQTAKILHDGIDAWVPPSHINLIQIGGWGLDTISGLMYTDAPKEVCDYVMEKNNIKGIDCKEETSTFYDPIFTVDGDETVITPSSLMVPAAENVGRYWMDLFKFNDLIYKINRNHANILEIDELREMIKNVISKHAVQDNLPMYISKELPNEHDDMENPIRIRMSLYSPLDIHLYDAYGNHTGPITEIIDGEGRTMIEENIPNSYYETIGEHKYVGWGTNDDVRVELDGYDAGSYTVKLQEIFVTKDGEEAGDATEFASLPTSVDTMVHFTVPASGIRDMSDLTADYDGDGEMDYAVTPQINGSTTLSEATDDADDEEDEKNDPQKEKKKEYRKASIAHWSAHRYITKSVSCPEKIAVTLTGKHFDKDAIIRIGDVKAQKVKVHNNKKAVATFCMNDLQKVKTDPLRTVSVTNPHAKRDKASNKININNVCNYE